MMLALRLATAIPLTRLPTTTMSRPLRSRLPALLIPLAVAILSIVPSFANAARGSERAVPQRTEERPARPLRIAVSVAPLAYVAERIGGERIEVTTVLIPPGASPETFSPSPRQIVAASRADIFLRVGHPHLLVERRYLEPLLAGLPPGRVLSLVEEGEANEAPAAGHHGEADDHSAEDPHVWTDPERMAAIARRLAALLVSLEPAAAASVELRLDAFLGDLDELDRWARARLEPVRGRAFLVGHPAWGHLAHHYGLRQVALEEGHKPPSPAQLVRRIEEARLRGYPVVFVQEGQPARSAEIVAQEIGARLQALDPLARDWLRNTRAVITALANGMARGAAREGGSHG